MTELDKLWQLLSGHKPLTDMLAESPMGGPGVYTVWAPAHDRPYLTLSPDEAKLDQTRATGSMQVDVWGDGQSHEALRPIVRALVDLLDGATLGESLRLYYAGGGPEQDADPTLVRWRVVFNLRRVISAECEV